MRSARSVPRTMPMTFTLGTVNRSSLTDSSTFAPAASTWRSEECTTKPGVGPAPRAGGGGTRSDPLAARGMARSTSYAPRMRAEATTANALSTGALATMITAAAPRRAKRPSVVRMAASAWREAYV